VATVEDIMAKQQYIINLAQKMEDEEDVDVKVQLAKIMQEEAEKLEAIAHEYEAEMTKEYPPPPRAGFEVVLTPDQSARIVQATGIKLTAFWIDDPGGFENEQMLFTHKDVIEEKAMDWALRKMVADKMFNEAAEAADQQLNAIEDDEVTQEMLDLIEELRKDPNFLNGLLQMKKK
jgi:hypothetical protein